MLFVARSTPLLPRPVLLALGLLVLAATGEDPAAAQESGGFFSRFLPSFGSTPAAPAPAAAPKPPAKPSVAEVPSGPTEANPFATGGGGLIATMNGRRSNACDGVVCMLMGGETKGEPAAAPVATAPAATTVASRRPVDDRVSPRKERCTAPANDPWRCYR